MDDDGPDQLHTLTANRVPEGWPPSHQPAATGPPTTVRRRPKPQPRRLSWHSP